MNEADTSEIDVKDMQNGETLTGSQQRSRRSSVPVSAAVLLGLAGSKIKAKASKKEGNQVKAKKNQDSKEAQKDDIATNVDDNSAQREWTEPFKQGWRREIVHRGIHNHTKGTKLSDVYYFSPENKKLRSVPMIIEYLARSNSKLTRECFTFLSRRVYHEPQETIRNAGEKSKKGDKVNKHTEAFTQKADVDEEIIFKQESINEKLSKDGVSETNELHNTLRGDIEEIMSANSLPEVNNTDKKQSNEFQSGAAARSKSKRKHKATDGDGSSLENSVKRIVFDAEAVVEESLHRNISHVSSSEQAMQNSSINSSRKRLSKSKLYESSKKKYKPGPENDRSPLKNVESTKQLDKKLAMEESDERMVTSVIEEKSLNVSKYDEKENHTECMSDSSDNRLSESNERALQEIPAKVENDVPETIQQPELSLPSNDEVHLIDDETHPIDNGEDHVSSTQPGKYDHLPKDDDVKNIDEPMRLTNMCRVCMTYVAPDESDDEGNFLVGGEIICEACLTHSKENELMRYPRYSREDDESNREESIGDENDDKKSDEKVSETLVERSRMALSETHTFVVEPNITKSLDISKSFQLRVESHERLIEPGSTYINDSGLNIRLSQPLPAELSMGDLQCLSFQVQNVGDTQVLVVKIIKPQNH